MKPDADPVTYDDIDPKARREGSPLDDAIPPLDDLIIRSLKSVGPFEIEVYGAWHHLVFSPDPGEGQTQIAMVHAYRQHHASRASDTFGAMLAAVERRAVLRGETLRRLLAALPRDADLLGARVPIRFDDNGDPYLYFKRSQWHLSKGGEWCIGKQPDEPNTVTTTHRPWWRFWSKQ